MSQPENPRSTTNKAVQELQTIRVQTRARTEFKDITAEVTQLIGESGVQSGLCCLYVPHTTAGILINENDDPDVVADIADTLNRLAPREASYKHWEGNADSHVKAALLGSSQTIPIEAGKLALGRWQGIFFCEFDGPRQREVKVKIVRE
ncbi:MAG: secondary thiamine-phosphate synthase enzyme YjbQ [Terriglobia bacterium]